MRAEGTASTAARALDERPDLDVLQRLHDEVIPQVSGAILVLAAGKTDDVNLRRCRKALDEASSSLRSLVNGGSTACTYGGGRELADLALSLGGQEVRLSGAATAALLAGVSEALANAAKHAPGSTVNVRAIVGTQCLRLEFSNPRPRRPASGPGGAGLRLLAERLRSVGGRMSRKRGRSWTLAVEVPRR